MNNCKLLVVLLLFVMAMSGCELKNKTYDYYNDFQYDMPTPKEIALDGIEITEEEMNTYYQNAYGWKNLTSHNVFWDEEEIQVTVNFVFNEDVELWEINSARKYALNTYVFKQLLSLGSPETYQNWAHGKEIQYVYVQMYANNILLCQDYYKSNDRLVEEEFHYENADMELKNQLYDSEKLNCLKKEIEKYIPKESVIVVKTDLLQQKIIFQIIAESQVNPDYLSKIEIELLILAEEMQKVILELYESKSSTMYYRVEIE